LTSLRGINIRATEQFEAVARLGTVTKAVGELGVSTSAVSQQIKQLETQLGVKLLRREKMRLVLTLCITEFISRSLTLDVVQRSLWVWLI